ncbi:hypothetical protein B0H11DRAFT_1901719 [Mycena galericulata]|nr:hypothetical protein B0H11DRAFT_1901719 [Mycena galericulata]
MSTPQPGATATHVFSSVVLPVLTLAKGGATGIGVPGVEPAINGVLELATMLVTMKANKEDLSALGSSLNKLITIDVSGTSGDLEVRLAALSSMFICPPRGFRNLKPIAAECKSITEKGRLNRFFKSKEYKQKIGDIKSSIASYIQEFTFYGNISIEKLVGDIVKKGL